MVAVVQSLSRHILDKEVKVLLNNVVDSMERTELYLGNKKIGVALDGLMSGWKTTSLYGSIINWTLFQCGLVFANMGPPSYIAVLGDDIDVSYNQLVDLKPLYTFYAAIEFPIAMNKTRVT